MVVVVVVVTVFLERADLDWEEEEDEEEEEEGEGGDAFSLAATTVCELSSSCCWAAPKLGISAATTAASRFTST